MRVMFSTEPATGVRNHLGVVRELAARGHEVIVAVHGELDFPELERLALESPLISVEQAASPSTDGERRWVALGADVRSSLDFLLFLDERFNDTYRERSRRRAPRPMLMLMPLLRVRLLRSLLQRVLELAERAIPADPQLERYLRDRAPEVVLFTPYVGLRTMQIHYLRAAKSLGLRTAICVKSWDNLSSKSALRPVPDRVFVWNETQQVEAESLHGIDRRRVVVTGAQCFDSWLEMQPRSRAAFGAEVALDLSGPLVLYTCCAPWAGLQELPFILTWLNALRASEDDLVATAPVLVRPHPKRPDALDGEDLPGPTVVWPAHGESPLEGAAAQDYFDSIAHSAAVVGLNTTAMLEAALLDRPVLTVLDPRYQSIQQETLHFRYLLETAGGLLDVAEDLDEHVRQLGRMLRHPERAAERARAFTLAFLRPFGADVAATPLFVDEVERLASDAAPRPWKPSPLLRSLRPVLNPLARRAARAS